MGDVGRSFLILQLALRESIFLWLDLLDFAWLVVYFADFYLFIRVLHLSFHYFWPSKLDDDR
jgi:hypothetical protein